MKQGQHSWNHHVSYHVDRRRPNARHGGPRSPWQRLAWFRKCHYIVESSSRQGNRLQHQCAEEYGPWNQKYPLGQHRSQKHWSGLLDSWWVCPQLLLWVGSAESYAMEFLRWMRGTLRVHSWIRHEEDARQLIDVELFCAYCPYHCWAWGAAMTASHIPWNGRVCGRFHQSAVLWRVVGNSFEGFACRFPWALSDRHFALAGKNNILYWNRIYLSKISSL